MNALATGSDGITRCAWAGSDELYIAYHDTEWGWPLHTDRLLFEKISLEGFQAGLSWITILRRREAFRAAFHGFDISTVAAFTDDDVERLVQNAAIIRHRGKIRAVVNNARVVADLVANSGTGALDRLVWGFAPTHLRPRPRTFTDFVATTPESSALSKHLRSLGFSFVGPTTMYALMQSAGLVDDHVEGCFRATPTPFPVPPADAPSLTGPTADATAAPTSSRRPAEAAAAPTSESLAAHAP